MLCCMMRTLMFQALATEVRKSCSPSPGQGSGKSVKVRRAECHSNVPATAHLKDSSTAARLGDMLCVVCHEPAVVWCHNDEAALCLACDRAVHSAGPLAWKHRRTRLSSGAPYMQCAHESGSSQPPVNKDALRSEEASLLQAPQGHMPVVRTAGLACGISLLL